MGSNVSTTFISCPADDRKTLGIKLPFLVMIIKNLKKYFTFEVQVLDDKNVRRRFRASNYQSTTRVKPFICTMPMRLDEGWNQIQFNLSDFTRRAYGTNYIETLRVQIHANCRLRRIYFSDRLYSEEELPPEFKLFLPVQKGRRRAREVSTSASFRVPAAPEAARSGHARRVFPVFFRVGGPDLVNSCAGRFGRPEFSLRRSCCSIASNARAVQPAPPASHVVFMAFFSIPLPGPIPAPSCRDGSC